MAQAYIGEIRLFAGIFAPRNWAFCYGQKVGADENAALFSLIGSTYGGDGHTFFELPDFRGRIPVHQGQGAGLAIKPIGARYGKERVTLALFQLPNHTHPLFASTSEANTDSPVQTVLAKEAIYRDYDPSDIQNLNHQAIRTAGGGRSHYNMMPCMALSFIIALKGIFPSRD